MVGADGPLALGCPNANVAFGSCGTSAVGTTVRNCTGDEGRPFEVGKQVLVSIRRNPLLAKAMARPERGALPVQSFRFPLGF